VENLLRELLCHVLSWLYTVQVEPGKGRNSGCVREVIVIRGDGCKCEAWGVWLVGGGGGGMLSRKKTGACPLPLQVWQLGSITTV
jgi:hypothetical protein